MANFISQVSSITQKDQIVWALLYALLNFATEPSGGIAKASRNHSRYRFFYQRPSATDGGFSSADKNQSARHVLTAGSVDEAQGIALS